MLELIFFIIQILKRINKVFVNFYILAHNLKYFYKVT